MSCKLCPRAHVSSAQTPSNAHRCTPSYFQTHSHLFTRTHKKSPSIFPSISPLPSTSSLPPPLLGSQAHGLTVDTPCVVALTKNSSNLMISMANPDNKAANVTVKTPWGLKTRNVLSEAPLESVTCNADGSVIVMLPGAPRAGATVTISCDLDV